MNNNLLEKNTTTWFPLTESECKCNNLKEIGKALNLDGDIRIYYECQDCGSRHYEE